MGIKKLTKKQINNTRKLRDKGLTYREIGNKFNVSHQTIRRYLNPSAREYYMNTNKNNRKDINYVLKERKYVRDKYNNDPEYREKVKNSTNDWYKKPKNKKRINQLVLSYYHKNKYRWNSRKASLLMYKNKKYQHLFPKKICPKCGSKKNIEIHHETYSSKIKDIILDLKNKQIYFLCRNCHRKQHTHKSITKDFNI